MAMAQTPPDIMNPRLCLLLLTLAFAGCVPSWNPFYTDRDLIFDPALVGHWRPTDAAPTSKERWKFTRAGDRSYQFSHIDEECRSALFDARLFQLNGQRFLDLYLTQIEGDGLKVNAWAAVSLVPAHLLLKVESIEPTLKLAAMDPDWIKRLLQTNSNAIAHRVMSDGSIVLAAGTAELQQFVRSHLDQPGLFGSPMVLKRE